MLTPEIAKGRLQQWMIDGHEVRDGKTIKERLLARRSRLPKEFHAPLYAICKCDVDGKPYPLLTWRENIERANAAFAEFDACDPAQRVRFFGEFLPKLAHEVELAWQFLKSVPYTQGYLRRSFRAPRHPAATLAQRRSWLEELLELSCKFQSDVLTAPWLAVWAPHLGKGYGTAEWEIGRLLAAVIDDGGPQADEVFGILAASARNEHEIGGMGRHVIYGLLLAGRPEGWELMEKLLLAAQRQEGLRQSILETVDQAHPLAFRRMLRLIRDHDLARFSAVVRAVDVWFGYGWDSASVKTVNDTIEKVLTLLEEPQAQKRACQSKQAEEVFQGLWAMAFHDAMEAIPIAAGLLSHGRPEHRYVALVHLADISLRESYLAALPALDDPDLRVACGALRRLGEPAAANELTNDDLFERLERLYQRLPEKPLTLKPLVWPWTGWRVDRTAVAAAMFQALGRRLPTRLLPYLKSFDPPLRTRCVGLLAEQKKWDTLTRETLLELAGDSSSDVRKAAFEALAKQSLQTGDAERLEAYLSRKASDLRAQALGLLAKQRAPEATGSADRLLSSSNSLQRLAGLELVRRLAEANRQRAACQERARAYEAAHRQLSTQERAHLAAIKACGLEEVTLANALGLLNPAERTPVVPPQVKNIAFITSAAIACLQSLDELVHQHREAQVVLEQTGGTEHKLLGELTYGFHSPEWAAPPDKSARQLPLRDIWEQWRDRRPSSLRDADGLELLRACLWVNMGERDWKDWQNFAKRSPPARAVADKLRGGQKPVELRYGGIILDVLQWLLYLQPPKGLIDYLLDAVETAFASLPAKLVGQLSAKSDWRNTKPFEFWVGALEQFCGKERFEKTPAHWARYWQLMHWQDEPVPGVPRKWPALELLQRGYAAQAATPADWYDQLLGQRPESRWGFSSTFRDLASLTNFPCTKQLQSYLKQYPEIQQVIDRCRERILEVELARGDQETAATIPALALRSLFGIDTLLRILAAFDKQPFKVDAWWRGNLGRPLVLTHLARITYPAACDTLESVSAKLAAAVAAGHVPQERILELAFLAPQWARYIQVYLGWDGFCEALYWFLAHMRYVWSDKEQAAIAAGVADESDDEEPRGKATSAWERLIMERTPLTAEQRGEGAVDVAWFQRTYAQLTPKRWQAMAQAARFAASPAQAKRAEFIADVLLGKASRKELIGGIRNKKLKDHVRLLGLLPLTPGARRQADLAERYQVLQEYRRYAKQLSAMTKEGALRAAQVGFENLARMAGYPDPLRLEWAMEAESVQDLAGGSISATRDGVTVTLQLDERCSPHLTIRRGDKELKSIPPDIKKKDKTIASLMERVGELKRQSSRMRQSLETAMCRGDTFSGEELVQLCRHALVAPLLTRLVLVGEGIIGYPDRGGKVLRDYAGRLEPVKKTERLRIAHPHDLLTTSQWHAWQHECFAAERVQPFKQVFRELYVVTQQEQGDRVHSRRYAGQQVQPRQAFALWGQRDWNARQGVSKTFYDLGITAAVEFNYGYGTPLEVEGLTIETVMFWQRDAGELPLADVPPRVFSEVMRDLDLVVSVAHRGGVDPEASASTVEMRASLLRETCQLLDLDNVRLKEPHALVDGQLGHYSVHLGSAVVHKLPGGALCIVPVHAQHRGRLFLPFADDDPKTAEVISKVLLLARDGEILDPGILEQLRRG
jgi:hypothetical protein